MSAKKRPKSIEIKNNTTAFNNLDDKAIIISSCDLKFKLYKFKEGISRIFKIRESFGVMFATFIPLITTKSENYEEFIKIPGNIWYAVILLLFILAVTNVIFQFVFIVISYVSENFSTVDDFVDNLIFYKKGRKGLVLFLRKKMRLKGGDSNG
jgi:hypothetical protein